MRPLFLDRPYDRLHTPRSSESAARYASPVEHFDAAPGPRSGSVGDRAVGFGMAFAAGFVACLLVLTA